MGETSPQIWVPVIIGILVMLLFIYMCCLKQDDAVASQSFPGFVETQRGGSSTRVRRGPTHHPPPPPYSGLFGRSGLGGGGGDEWFGGMGMGTGMGNHVRRPRPAFHPMGSRGGRDFMRDEEGFAMPWTERMVHRGQGGFWGDDDDADIIERRPVFM